MHICNQVQTHIIVSLEGKGLDVFVPTSRKGIIGQGTHSLEFSGN